MNEHGFWEQVRAALHKPPSSVCRKLTDAFTAGTPDAFYVIEGVTGFLELKYLRRYPARSDVLRVGVTPAQQRYLEMLNTAGGRAHVLLGVDADWYLLLPAEVQNGVVTRATLETYAARGKRREMATTLRAALGARSDF